MACSVLRCCFVSLLLVVFVPAAARAAAPAPPTALSGRVLFGTQIELTWSDNSDNETAFAVWRQVDGGVWTFLGWTAPNEAIFKDRTVSVGHAYAYRVRATNSEGASAWTNETELSVLPIFPVTPMRLTGTPNNGRLELAWTDASTNETAFAIWKQASDGTWARVGLVPPNSIRFFDTTQPVPISALQQTQLPFAVDRQAVSLGLEVSFALSPVAKQHFWRITVPGATDTDLEWMLRDGIVDLATVGDLPGLDPNTGAIAAQIQVAVATRIALAQADPAYAREDALHHSPDNPRLVQLPLVERVEGSNLGSPTQSKVIGFASLWLTGASQHELKGYFVALTTPPATPRVHYRVRAINNNGASEWSNEAVWPISVVSGTASLF
jgi:hypothetical protein